MLTVVELQTLEYFGACGGVRSGAQQSCVTGYCWWKQCSWNSCYFGSCKPGQWHSLNSCKSETPRRVFRSFGDLDFSSEMLSRKTCSVLCLWRLIAQVFWYSFESAVKKRKKGKTSCSTLIVTLESDPYLGVASPALHSAAVLCVVGAPSWIPVGR